MNHMTAAPSDEILPSSPIEESSVSDTQEDSPMSAHSTDNSIFGCMKGTFRITGDIISPEPDSWNALDDSAPL